MLYFCFSDFFSVFLSELDKFVNSVQYLNIFKKPTVNFFEKRLIGFFQKPGPDFPDN